MSEYKDTQTTGKSALSHWVMACIPLKSLTHCECWCFCVTEGGKKVAAATITTLKLVLEAMELTHFSPPSFYNSGVHPNCITTLTENECNLTKLS